jgi:hypothetical protein
MSIASKLAKSIKSVEGILENLDSVDDGCCLESLQQSSSKDELQTLAQMAYGMACSLNRISSIISKSQNATILANAKLDTELYHVKLIKEQHVISSAQICESLAITRQALHKAVKTKRIFALRLANKNYYPSFFVSTEMPRSQIEKVSVALGNLNGLSKWLYLTQPSYSLGGITPLDALKKGKFEEVLRLASAFADL